MFCSFMLASSDFEHAEVLLRIQWWMWHTCCNLPFPTAVRVTVGLMGIYAMHVYPARGGVLYTNPVQML